MKRYSLIVVLHIIGIAFLSVGVYLLVDAGLWFSTLMAFFDIAGDCRSSLPPADDASAYDAPSGREPAL